MKNGKPQILYSDPVNEIISVPPRKIIRWGTSVILAVFVVLIIIAWIIKYPDVVIAPIEITTVNPPVTLLTKISGRINRIYVKNGDKVSNGQLLAVMETAASITDVMMLKAVVDSIGKPEEIKYRSVPLLAQLGELQPYYASFLKTLSDYDTFNWNDFYGKQIISVNEEIKVLQEYIGKLVAKERLISDNLMIDEKKYMRDSTLFNTKVYSESEFEKSRQDYNASKLELQGVRLDQSQTNITLEEKKQLLQDYIIKRDEEKQNLISLLHEAFLNLEAQIKIWENKYELVTPVDGIAAFTKFWNENQSVTVDQPVLNVVPENEGDYIGRITLSMERSGKVRVSQAVNIKLSGFPYLEYGIVRGIVKSKSLVASGDAYIIELNLPQGLTTLYGKKLEFTQNMQGQAEIITENQRLLQKIVNPFRYLISRNKM